jgi:aerobic-type carbon monoxide dehydrogenase small subunit (CoxS/CutS family)
MLLAASTSLAQTVDGGSTSHAEVVRAQAAIRTALDPHLCRCGSHNRIIRAVQAAAKELVA